ncbi:segregation/condensation protein A [Salsuginibacillus kocurii]|uniref:segregation/condensation protein A n=1 Tax=Salsuginibacillus kocurii TaxID=427078 RepID=UPI00036A0522|nr:segregation/condensation protein A [Salsuginibacillus kocurii]
MNTYNVKIDAFEGPLDLLLHLIQQAEVDIYDIPVAEITEQYVHYIHAMQELELDIASEYLVMAATLLELKSKMLLPDPQVEIEDEEEFYYEEDPRQELIERLEEYKQFKEAAAVLSEREKSRAVLFTKPPTADESFEPSSENETVPDIGEVTVYDMLQAFERARHRVDVKRPITARVQKEEVTIEERMGEVKHVLKERKTPLSFLSWVEHEERTSQVLTFLAILELMKTRAVYCEQSNNFEDILIYTNEEGVSHDFH